MSSNYEDEPYVSPEQEALWKTLTELSSGYQEAIDVKRKEAWSVLLDKSSTPNATKEVLNNYFSFRMDPSTYEQIISVARTLCDDRSFHYNDAPLILNNLNPFFESITHEDVILAFHNYRLSADDESLSHFVKLIGYYTEYAFDMDGLHVRFPVSDGILTYDESISHMNQIILFVDEYLQKYGEKWEQFTKKYELKNEPRIDFYSRIDEEAAQSFGKLSPLEIRITKLIKMLSKFKKLDDFDEAHIEGLFNKLYKKSGIANDTTIDDLSSIQWPTLADLLALSEAESENEKKRGYRWNSYVTIIDSIKSI